MAQMSIPVPELELEYRGRSKAGAFDKDDGERVEYAAGLKFEFDQPDGEDVGILVLRQNKLDEVAPPGFDTSQLQRGDRVTVSGVVVIRADGGYFRPTGITPLGALAAAA